MLWLLSLALQAGIDPYDAVVAAPTSHRVLMEDSNVRVLRVEVAPGATEPPHTHGWPSVMIFERPQPLTYIVYESRDGTLVETRRIDVPAMPADVTERADAEPLHAVRNRGDAPFVALRIEFKRRP